MDYQTLRHPSKTSQTLIRRSITRHRDFTSRKRKRSRLFLQVEFPTWQQNNGDRENANRQNAKLFIVKLFKISGGRRGLGRVASVTAEDFGLCPPPANGKCVFLAPSFKLSRPETLKFGWDAFKPETVNDERGLSAPDLIRPVNYDRLWVY